MKWAAYALSNVAKMFPGADLRLPKGKFQNLKRYNIKCEIKWANIKDRERWEE